MTPGHPGLLTSGECGPERQKGQDKSICLTFKVSPEKISKPAGTTQTSNKGANSSWAPRGPAGSQPWKRTVAIRESQALGWKPCLLAWRVPGGPLPAGLQATSRVPGNSAPRPPSTGSYGATVSAVSPVRGPDPDADLRASALLPAQLTSN